MNKKPYIKPTAVLFQFGTAESLADEVIINTSNATIIGEEGGELNALQGTLFDGEQNESDETIVLKAFPSLWDEEE